MFAAWSSAKQKTQWFHGPPESTGTPLTQDFRVGGVETVTTSFADGSVHAYRATFCDIVPNERIVFVYEMWLGEVHISVSLTTVELRPDGSGTLLKFTEQGVFLNGFNDNGGREFGSGMLLDNLAVALRD